MPEPAEDGGAVARSDLLRGLFAAWAASDDGGFLRAAQALIEDERRKRHGLLASQLETALSDPRRPGRAVLSLRPLPKGRDERPLLTLSEPRRSFDDLVLPGAVATALRQVAAENGKREVLRAHGVYPRQRILVVGPPGTGKSASAHAIAAYLSLPVATANLAALTSSYLGETARNIEAVVRFAEANPCVLLLDEFDALATERSQPGDHGEVRRVVATVLQVLEQRLGESVVVATSNHPQLLDSAVWRRFDEVVTLGLLDRAGALRLVELKLAAVRSSVKLTTWASRMATLSPADVELVVEDAIRVSLLEGATVVGAAHMDVAWERLRSRHAAIASSGGAPSRSRPRKGAGTPPTDAGTA